MKMGGYKRYIVVGFLSVAVVFNAYANDSDRIDQLEKETQEIKLRLQKIESLLSKPSNAQEPVTSAEGWKSVTNWRRLTTEMGESDVRTILGEPQRVDGGNLATWYYQNRGIVSFRFGKVDGWNEPDPRHEIRHSPATTNNGNPR